MARTFAQVFLDIVEQVNVLMNSKGSILRCDVNGKMIMKAYLSGMPEVKVGLNDRLEVRACCGRSSSPASVTGKVCTISLPGFG